MEWPKKQKDRIGMKARLRRPVRNGLMEIPAGAIVTIKSAWRGTHRIESDPCSCCGVAMIAGMVPGSLLEPLDR